jgi:hypothetical protein
MCAIEARSWGAPSGLKRRNGLGRLPRPLAWAVVGRPLGAHASTNLVLLDPDVRQAFRSERAVNDAFDLVIELRKVGSSKRRDCSSNID